MRGTGTSYLCPALGTLLDGCHDLIVCTCFPVTYAAPAWSNLYALSRFLLHECDICCMRLYSCAACPCVMRWEFLCFRFRKHTQLVALFTCLTECLRTLHSFQTRGAAEEIQPMLFTESTSTPAVSSTPFTLAPPHSCESKSCDFLLWNIWPLTCPWVKSSLPHTLTIFLTPEQGC